MISWLSEWLKEIILIVLLAIFADLLLPSQVMQRYVKLVFSLMIVLVMLSPVVELLHSQSVWKQAADAMSRQDTGDSGAVALDEVKRQGRQLAQSREAQALSIVTDQVASVMSEQLERELGVSVVNIRTEIEKDENGEVVIKRVEADLGMVAPAMNEPDLVAEAEQSGAGPAIAIKPVKSVEIGTSAGGIRSPPPHIIEQARTWIAEHWAVNPEQIHLNII